MVKIHRVRNPDISYKLLPWYIPADKDRIEIGEEVYRRLAEDPDNTFCIIGEDNGVCKGFIFAYIENGDCFVWQANAKLEIAVTVQRTWNTLLEWAVEKGAKRAVMYPAENKKAFQRKYGFEDMENGGMQLCLSHKQDKIAKVQNSQQVTLLNRERG